VGSWPTAALTHCWGPRLLTRKSLGAADPQTALAANCKRHGPPTRDGLGPLVHDGLGRRLLKGGGRAAAHGAGLGSASFLGLFPHGDLDCFPPLAGA
jgi:hypothetical protein